MQLTGVPVNIFVFGDLVLDHFIPVSEKQGHFQAVGRERVFDGRPRRTVAGGAANCARVIAALSHGRACLWGISGHSPWGSFVQILQRSQLADGSDRGVIFHGSHNESHQMNTITRIVNTDPDGTRHREFRVDDVHLFSTTETQRRDALAYLQAEAKEHGVHAIIINDLDMSSLDDELILAIGEFARLKGIPLFIDPKRDWKKYRSIRVTCALPNLTEWCHIVEDVDAESHWRDDIIAGRSLDRMAVRCLQYMPNADFHIIKCDRHGAVIIGPAGSGRRFIRHIMAHPTGTPKLPGQLGAGDVLAAALALEYANIRDEPKPSERILSALAKASGVVACYLQLDWQKVPNERELNDFKLQEMRTAHQAEVTDGVLLLPPADRRNIDLGDIAILGSGLVSIDGVYKSEIEELVKYLTAGWEASVPGSAILTGRGGGGKSELEDILRISLAEIGVYVWSDFKCSKEACPDIDSAVIAISAKLSEENKRSGGLLILIDEAFGKASHLLLGDKGKMLLQAFGKTQSPKVRYLFIDADYHRHREEISRSQFLSRCRVFELPDLSSRRSDIPYIFAASCLKILNEKSAQIHTARISEAVLLSIINWMLKLPEEDQSPRLIASRAEEIVKKALESNPRAPIPEIRRAHLPTDLLRALGETDAKGAFLFSWAINECTRSPGR